jgi:hypothetical protein
MTQPTAQPTQKPFVEPVTIADITAKVIEASLLDQAEYDRLERMTVFQAPGGTPIAVDKLFPFGGEDLYTFAMFDGESDRVASVPGDVRVYVIPRTAVLPGVKAFRRFTLHEGLPKLKEYMMTYEAFIAAVAGEVDELAIRLGIVEIDEEELEEAPTSGPQPTTPATV